MTNSSAEIVDEEKHGEKAFWIAVMLILGFLILIGIPVMRNDIESATGLTGIFSGWIAAIIGFYFMRNQTLQVAKIAEGSGIERGVDVASGIERTLDKLNEEHQETLGDIEFLKNHYKQLRKKYEELKKASNTS